MLEISLLPFVLAGDRGDRHAARDVGARVGDELLGAVHHPLAVLERGAGVGVAGVGAGLRLGQAEGGQLLPAAELRQPVVLLLVGAPEVDRHRAERGVGGHRDRHRGVDPRQLLDRQRVGERVGAAAAVLLGEGDAHQPELAHLRDELVGEGLGAVELLGDRRDLLAGEVADGVAQQPLLVGQLEVHRGGESRKPGYAAALSDFWRRLHPGTLDRAGLAHIQLLAALGADPAVVDLAAALALVDDDRGAPLGLLLVLVAPLHQGDHHRPEVEALLGEEVLVALGALAVGAAFQDALVDHPLQAGGEHVPGDAERALHLRELAAAVEDLPHDEQRPALTDQLEAASDGADLSLVFVAQHECDLRTLGCITQLTLLGSATLVA